MAVAIAFWFFGPATTFEDARPGPYDGPLRLLVLGDDQLIRGDGGPGWPRVARNVLRKELAREVDLTVELTGTAAEVAAYLQSPLQPTPGLVVVAVGWEDGAPGQAAAADDPGTGRIAKLATSAAVEGGPGGFYLRSPAGASTRTTPAAFLRLLGDAKRAAAAVGVPIVFVEQPGYVGGAVAPTTGARPGPWVSVVPKLAADRDPAAWFDPDDPVTLSEQGHRRLGGVIGEGLLPHLR